MTTKEFSIMYKSYYPSLIRYAYSLTKDKYTSKDLLQDASIKAYRNKSTLSKVGKFKQWFYKVIYNTFLGDYLKRKRRQEIINNLQVGSNYFLSSGAVRSNVIDMFAVSRINNAINKLGSKYSESMQLYLNGYSYKEISKQQAIPIGTVKSRINMARNKLQESLAE